MPVEPAPSDDLGDRLAEVYLVVGPLYRQAVRVVEADTATSGLTIGVRAVLDVLRRGGPMTVPDVARAQTLSRQFVQRTVNEARAACLVEMRDNPAHRRSRLVALTPAGRAAIEAVVDRERVLLGRTGGGVTAADVAVCLRVLRAMLAAAEDVPGPPRAGDDGE